MSALHAVNYVPRTVGVYVYGGVNRNRPKHTRKRIIKTSRIFFVEIQNRLLISI